MSKGLVFADIAGLTLLRDRLEQSGQKAIQVKKMITMIDQVISTVTRQMVQPDRAILEEQVSISLSRAYSAISNPSRRSQRSSSPTISEIIDNFNPVSDQSEEEEEMILPVPGWTDESEEEEAPPPPPPKKVTAKRK